MRFARFSTTKLSIQNRRFSAIKSSNTSCKGREPCILLIYIVLKKRRQSSRRHATHARWGGESTIENNTCLKFVTPLQDTVFRDEPPRPRCRFSFSLKQVWFVPTLNTIPPKSCSSCSLVFVLCLQSEYCEARSSILPISIRICLESCLWVQWAPKPTEFA